MKIIKCDYCTSTIDPTSQERISQGEHDWCDAECKNNWGIYRATSNTQTGESQ